MWRPFLFQFVLLPSMNAIVANFPVRAMDAGAV
jgi:hypothetical protein